MRLHPRHRADCFDLFVAPKETADIQVQADSLVLSKLAGELELAAARAGRTWNAQFTHVINVCSGKHLPDFDDGRSVEDWRTLLSPCAIRTSETGNWSPITCLWVRTPPSTQVEG